MPRRQPILDHTRQMRQRHPAAVPTSPTKTNVPPPPSVSSKTRPRPRLPTSSPLSELGSSDGLLDGFNDKDEVSYPSVSISAEPSVLQCTPLLNVNAKGKGKGKQRESEVIPPPESLPQLSVYALELMEHSTRRYSERTNKRRAPASLGESSQSSRLTTPPSSPKHLDQIPSNTLSKSTDRASPPPYAVPCEVPKRGGPLVDLYLDRSTPRKRVKPSKVVSAITIKETKPIKSVSKHKKRKRTRTPDSDFTAEDTHSRSDVPDITLPWPDWAMALSRLTRGDDEDGAEAGPEKSNEAEAEVEPEPLKPIKQKREPTTLPTGSVTRQTSRLS